MPASVPFHPLIQRYFSSTLLLLTLSTAQGSELNPARTATDAAGTRTETALAANPPAQALPVDPKNGADQTRGGIPVAQWSAENNATDSIGHHSAHMEGTISFIAGRIGRAFGLDGGTSKIVITDVDALNRSLGQFTVSAWIRRASTTRVSQDPDGAGIFVGEIGSFSLGLFSDGRLYFSQTGLTELIVSRAQVTDTQWHLITVTKSTRNQIALYMDGQRVAGGTFNSILLPSARFGIGAIATPWGVPNPITHRGRDFGFLGAIDEVKFFNQILTESQIAFAASPEGLPKTILPTPPNPTIGHPGSDPRRRGGQTVTATRPTDR